LVAPATSRLPLSQGERQSSSRLLGPDRRDAGKRRGESKQNCARRPRSQPPWTTSETDLNRAGRPPQHAWLPSYAEEISGPFETSALTARPIAGRAGPGKRQRLHEPASGRPAETVIASGRLLDGAAGANGGRRADCRFDDVSGHGRSAAEAKGGFGSNFRIREKEELNVRLAVFGEPRPTGKRPERSSWRLLDHMSDSAGALAGRHESGDRQAPLRPDSRRRRRTLVHAKAQLRADRQPRPERRRRGASRDWRLCEVTLSA
jgi:hypothetical protein